MAYAFDDFNRADENPLAGNWETLYGSGNRIVSNQLIAAGGTQGVSAWKATTNDFGDDQFSQIKFTAVSNDDNYGPAVRMVSTGGGAGYILRYEHAFTFLSLRAVVAGAPSNIQTHTVSFAAGDTLKLVAVQNGLDVDLSIFKNGTQVGSTFTDNVYRLSGGQPGIWNGMSGSNATTVDDWYGGDGTEPTFPTITLNHMYQRMNTNLRI